ncbi:MAG TPA: Na+/H+ antiporter subunit E [Burkholderiales bacterium]|nr:Na+/H+ antiporter subunit E [Burkholderiales bacterium]
MKRTRTFPLLFVLLLAMWLLLQGRVTAGQVMLGSLVAMGATLALAALQPERIALRHPGTMLVLYVLVFFDMVRSNIAVARIVLHPGIRKQTSGFLDIPLQLRDPAGLAVLATIITATPGTAWMLYNSADGILTVHVLDLVDEETWVRIIKDRYERRLLRIFE